MLKNASLHLTPTMFTFPSHPTCMYKGLSGSSVIMIIVFLSVGTKKNIGSQIQASLLVLNTFKLCEMSFLLDTLYTLKELKIVGKDQWYNKLHLVALEKWHKRFIFLP